MMLIIKFAEGDNIKLTFNISNGAPNYNVNFIPLMVYQSNVTLNLNLEMMHNKFTNRNLSTILDLIKTLINITDNNFLFK